MTNSAPNSLASLQAKLQNYVLGNGAAGDLVSELTSGASDQSERRLHIYHAGYRSRMNEALQSAFEQTWAYLGDNQ
jgi:putative DNA-binding protein